MKRLILIGLVAMSGLWSVRAQLAITETMSSESTNLGTGLVVAGPDYWELSNFGTNTIDLSGYIFNDSDATRGGDANSSTLSGVSIAPGESIVLVQSGTLVATRDDFINWWGAANLPANLQVLFYSGNGLSASGDSVVLWAPTATSDADYVDRADFGEAVRGHSFTYNPTNGIFGIISSNGVGGAFKATTSDDEGSPGINSGPVALAFLQQPSPTNQTLPAGSDATFTVLAKGLPRPHYQWQFNGTNIDGAIQSTLIVTNVQATNAGNYSVILSNGISTATSSNAVLTVTTGPVPPTFTVVPPTNADAFIGQDVQFNAQANGSPTPTITWKTNNVTVATGSQLSFPSVQLTDAGTYTVTAANSAGSTNVTVTMTVGQKPRLLITEVMPSGSGETGHADWWELTSFDSRSYNLRGWRWDDSSHSLAPNNAYTFTNDIIIHPGESIIFVEGMSPDQFRTWWGTNLPPNLQIVSYTGGGLGLSQTADEVNVWNALTLPGNELFERICGVNFAQSFLGSTLIYDPENPPVGGVFGVFSTNSVLGEAANGVFVAAVGGSHGSPGYVVQPVYANASPTNNNNIAVNWNTIPTRNYTLLYATNLTDTNWTTLTSLTAVSTNSSATDSVNASQRFYRVGASIPVVTEP
ncbi:MAG TPA: immunoglobulin domain-containing protein [Verrucomicrobiae bacterium]|nr:immunoglobulin domain-containing protein [Verrucomicrobiae bacterium]